MNIAATILTAFISTTVGVVVTAVSRILSRANSGTKALENGTQCLLRAEIIRQNEKWVARGYCPVYAKDAVRREYEAYHALGGNGVITDLYNDILALPETPPKQSKIKYRRTINYDLATNFN